MVSVRDKTICSILTSEKKWESCVAGCASREKLLLNGGESQQVVQVLILSPYSKRFMRSTSFRRETALYCRNLRK